jgi:hypothetical protein
MAKLKISFEKIEPSDLHISKSYNLLSLRLHGISHHQMPSIEDHMSFVANHPYRAWFFVRLGGSLVGTLNLNADNTIGLNIIPGEIDNCYLSCIEFIKNNFQPLPEIKSVRSAIFAINVAPKNQELIDKLVKMKSTILQITYKI